jgi:rubrerythrin
MITIDKLIQDEEEAITVYEEFLSQSSHSVKTIAAVHRIIEQERGHIRMLKSGKIK